MASKATREALGLGALGEFAKAFVASRQDKNRQAQAEEQFARELAAKQLELERRQEAEAWDRQLKAAQFKAELDKAASDTTFTDPVTNKVYTQGAKLKPENAQAMNEVYNQMKATIPGLKPVNAPLISADVQQPGAGALPGVSGDPMTRIGPAQNVGPLKGSGGRGGSSMAQRDVAKAVADYEEAQAKSDQVAARLDSIVPLISKARGGVIGAGAQAASQALGVGTDSESFAATEQVTKALVESANEMLKATFPGAISDAEREELQKFVAAAPTMQPPQRALAVERIKRIVRDAALRQKEKADALGRNLDIEPQYKPRSAPKATPTQPGEPVAVYERGPDGKLRRVK